MRLQEINAMGRDQAGAHAWVCNKFVVEDVMSKLLIPFAVAVYCAGCAKPSTLVLEPYALADGKMYQDVVTIAADETGTAPVVTHSKTFELRTGYKGGRGTSSEPVATASGSSPGLVSTLSSAAVSSVIPAATGAAIAASGWARSRTTISNSNSSNANASNSNENNNNGNATNSNTTNNVNNNTNNNVNNNTNNNTNL